ncbi:MIP/aquaporin family protein [Ktedonospora formicarum]|uniref:Aquaporin n=1 Tax=Ktedonospora formicarum TaxID=2778364 RepID=A0A8J3HSA4_9CHLR|nr:MIP/aquaporin family protein [Ktedonospora formicarum]GHO42351.1 aquaporin [Ktedonospora formicarum]
MANRVASPTYSLAGVRGEALAEFFGTLVLVLFGDGAVASFVLFRNIPLENIPFAHTWPVVFLGWGFALMLGIYVAGAVSGAHLNPAVTLSLATTKRFPWNKVWQYIVAQMLGAFVAAAILFFIYRGAINHTLGTSQINSGNIAKIGNVFYTSKQDFVGTFGAFCTEALGTALLVGMIIVILDRRNQPVQANLNPLILGLLLAAIGASFGLNTGFAVNPARDFGPRLWMALAGGGLGALNSYTWVPLLAPIVGGLIAAFGYDYILGHVLAAREAKSTSEASARTAEPAVGVGMRGRRLRKPER